MKTIIIMLMLATAPAQAGGSDWKCEGTCADMTWKPRTCVLNRLLSQAGYNRGEGPQHLREECLKRYGKYAAISRVSNYTRPDSRVRATATCTEWSGHRPKSLKTGRGADRTEAYQDLRASCVRGGKGSLGGYTCFEDCGWRCRTPELNIAD